MTAVYPPLAPVSLSDAPSLREPSLFYAPPYETPAHEEFAWHLVKVLDPDSGLLPQVPVDTPVGKVWVDFVVETTLADGRMRRVGFELTGADEDEDHAALRDALLVGTHGLDALYRFRAADVFARVADVLLLVSGWERHLFSLRGRTNLERLASPEALLTIVSPSLGSVVLEAVPPVADEDDFAAAPVVAAPLTVVRRSAVHPLTWDVDYTRAVAVFGLVQRRAA